MPFSKLTGFSVQLFCINDAFDVNYAKPAVAERKTWRKTNLDVVVGSFIS